MQNSAHPTTRNTQQGGFTLIELMIVVAIIGVLASIAVPQYQNYVGRAQVSEAITLASSAKTSVSIYYITKGSFPKSLASAGLSDTTKGTYVTSMTISGDGVIAVKMRGNSPVVEDLQDTALKFVPAVSTDTGNTITWNCETTTGDEMPSKFLPASCRP
jgi:type IV pilus assembly protein PilA